MVQLLYLYMTIGKTISLTRWTFVGKVMSAFSYTKFVLAFLPKSKCLLISWQQSLSAGILEPKKIKYATIFTFSPFKGTCAVLRLVTQFCQTLCDPIDSSPPGSSVPWGFSRQEYWSRLPCPPPGDLPNPGTEPRSPSLQEDYLPAEPPGKPLMGPT